MPDSSIIAAPIAPADHIWRKQLAAGAEHGRKAIVEACKAEVAWATRHGGYGPEWALPVLIEAPAHVRAAYSVLAFWGPVDSSEYELRKAIMRLRAQRTAGWDVSETIKDIEWIWAERRKSLKPFWAAAREYRRLRERF